MPYLDCLKRGSGTKSGFKIATGGLYRGLLLPKFTYLIVGTAAEALVTQDTKDWNLHSDPVLLQPTYPNLGYF